MFIYKSNVKKILNALFISLIPLIIYGIYKNSLVLLLHNYKNIIPLINPILFPIIGLLSGFIVDFIKTKKVKLTFNMLYGLLISMIVPLSTNTIILIIIIPLMLYLFSLLDNKIAVNKVAIIKLIIVALLFLFHTYDYQNLMESSNIYVFSLFDKLIGRQVGGILSSSLILIIIGFIYLCFNYYYKKEISISAMITYIIATLLSYFMIKDIVIITNLLIASSTYFTFVFIATLTISSPITNKGKILYGILIGLLTAVVNIVFISNESAIIATAIGSLLVPLIDRLFLPKDNKKDNLQGTN